jgi:diacylglycerol kinase (ATP)
VKKRILFIINPISGDIKKANLPQLIAQHLDSQQFEYEIAYTERAGHASILAAQAVENEIDIVVAVGGDGSINEVAKSIINSPVILAIIPLGSGNALAYHLGLPVKNIVKAIGIINTGKVVKIDTLDSNKGAVICFAGIGLEAVAARTYRHLGKRGFLAYAWAAILSIFFKYKPQKVAFTVDGNKFEKEVYLFTVYNARFLGYKVGKVEQVSLTDGKMHLVIIKTFALWKLLWIAILELLGKIHLAKETEIIEAETLNIALPKKAHAQLDGDSFITSTDFSLKVLPLSLQVLVPQELENY